MSSDILEYIKADRQWPRRLRLPHAQLQLRNETDPARQKFWQAVIDANSDR
jgi:hypothetical protein